MSGRESDADVSTSVQDFAFDHGQDFGSNTNKMNFWNVLRAVAHALCPLSSHSEGSLALAM